MRTVLTAFNASPYLTILFKRCFDKWKSEIDEMLVCLHSWNPVIDDENERILKDPKVRFWRHPSYIELGEALDHIYPHAKGDVIITIDSDNFIFDGGVIKKFAESIENNQYDAVGSKGNSGGGDLAEHLINETGFVRLNSFMSFWDKKKIDSIDKWTFKRTYFKEDQIDDKIKELDWPICKLGWVDTCGILTYKYLKKYPRVWDIKPTDEGYMHVGGLSTFHRSVLGENGMSVIDVKSNLLNGQVTNPHILGWHLFLYEEASGNCSLKWHNEKYKRCMEDRIKRASREVGSFLNIPNKVSTMENEVSDEVNKIRANWRQKL